MKSSVKSFASPFWRNKIDENLGVKICFFVILLPREIFENLFNNQGPSPTETTQSLTDRGRQSMKSQESLNPLYNIGYINRF